MICFILSKFEIIIVKSKKGNILVFFHTHKIQNLFNKIRIFLIHITILKLKDFEKEIFVMKRLKILKLVDNDI